MPKSSDDPAHRPFTVAALRAAEQRRARPQTAGFAARVRVRKAPGTFLDPTALLHIFFIDRIHEQNILGVTAASFTANPVALTDMDVGECLARRADFPSAAKSHRRASMPARRSLAGPGPGDLENPNSDLPAAGAW